MTLRRRSTDSRASDQTANRGSQRHDHENRGADQRYLKIALVLIVAYMLIEVTLAVVAHSLALLADAGHMLTDAGSLGIALWAARLAQ